jgi:hypothetical protein
MNAVAAFCRGEAVHPQGCTIDAALGRDNERLAAGAEQPDPVGSRG